MSGFYKNLLGSQDRQRDTQEQETRAVEPNQDFRGRMEEKLKLLKEQAEKLKEEREKK